MTQARALQGLYAITDSQLLADGRLLPYCEAALKGGARLLQYRDKSTENKRRLREASALHELCQRYNADLIINDDWQLAANIGASLHLGQGDGSLSQARQALGQAAIIGSTCHASLELAERAQQQGANYLAFGRFFNSNTKPGAPSAQPELLAQARQRFALPVVAIGGVSLDNGASLIAQGADLLAVVHALFSAASPTEVEARARAFSALFSLS